MHMRRFTLLVPAALLALLSGCALYTDVSITPLRVNPQEIERGSDLVAMLRKSDYLRAVELRQAVESRQNASSADYANLGTAELAAGRFDHARRHLRTALDLQPTHTAAARIEWALAELEYLCNNYESSLDWAQLALSHGLGVKPWYIQYLTSLAGVQVYKTTGRQTSEMFMRTTRPDVPRIDVHLNGAKRPTSAIIDSGAVLSIASERLAKELPIRRLGDFHGTFFGLLGEPIEVEFGMLDSLTLGDIVVQNVPVAIMPDEKMRFAIAGKREFRIDFLIGANFLKEFRTELDFSMGRVTFRRLGAAERQPAADQNLFLQGFRPVVRGLVNGHGWYVFVLDTGSEITFLNETQLGTLPIEQLAPRAHSATLQGLGGSKKRGAKLADIEIGVDRWSGHFKTLPTYAAGEHEVSAGIIGENLLRKFRVVLDFGRMRVDLLRPRAPLPEMQPLFPADSPTP